MQQFEINARRPVLEALSHVLGSVGTMDAEYRDLARALQERVEQMRIAKVVAGVLAAAGRKPAPPPPARDGVHLAIAAHPQSGPDGINIRSELALCRAALLYADHVTLTSPTVSMLLDVQGPGTSAARSAST